MNTSERDSMLDRALDALRDDAPTNERVEAAASRVWAELRSGAADEDAAGHAAGVAREADGRRLAGDGRMAADTDPHAPDLTLIATASGPGGVIRSCADVRALLSVSAAELSPARRTLLRDHLTTCPDCRRTIGTAGIATTGGVKATHDSPTAAAPTRRPDASEVAASPSDRGRPRRLTIPRAIAAAVVLTIGLLAAGVLAPALAPAPVVASAAEVSEGLYRIEDGRLVPLEAGAELRARQRVRAGRTAGALLRLDDGSVVELDARTEVALAERDGRTVVELVRGAIVAGADQPSAAAEGSRDGPQILSGPLTAYADGALVAVTHGPLGTRITALDGDVRVTNDDDDTHLAPGQQLTSHPRVGQVAPRQEVAWSVALADRLARLKELETLEATLAAAPLPGLRYESRLLDRAPAETLLYAALPNLSPSLAEVEAELDAQLAASPALQSWWAEAVDEADGPTPQDVLGRLIALGTPLGDELAVALYGADANEPRPVVLAEVEDAAALRRAIEDELARIARDDGGPDTGRASDHGATAPSGGVTPTADDDGAPPPLEVRVLDQPSALEAALARTAADGNAAPNGDTSPAGGASPAGETVPSVDDSSSDDILWLWLGDGWLAAATDPASLRDARAGGFVDTPLGTRLQDEYRGGVGWLLGADLGALSRAETSADSANAVRSSAGAVRSSEAVEVRSETVVDADAALGADTTPGAEPVETGGTMSGRPAEPADVAAFAGLDAAYLVANQRTRGGVTQSDATVHFADGRRGAAAWLAEPGPVGALDLVAPDAHLATAFTVADPTLMLRDLLTLAGDSVPEVADDLEQAADRAALEALAGATGGEVAIALEGPVLPKPGWKVVLEVYDEAAFHEALAATVVRLDQQLQAEDGPRVTLEPYGDGRHVLRVDDEIDAVHLGYVGGYLVAVPAPVMLERTARDYALGRSLGQSGVLRAGLPDGDLPHVSALVYQNLQPVIGPAVDQLSRLEALSSEQQALLERARAELAPQVLVARAGPNRITLSARAESSWLSGDLNQLIGRGGFFGLATLLETAEIAAEPPAGRQPAAVIE